MEGSESTSTLSLKDLSVSGLAKRKLGRLPSPYAVIAVDGAGKVVSKTIDKTQNPKWKENFDVSVPSSASRIGIDVFNKTVIGKDDLIGGFIGHIKEIADKDSSHALFKDRSVVGEIRFKLSIKENQKSLVLTKEEQAEKEKEETATFLAAASQPLASSDSQMPLDDSKASILDGLLAQPGGPGIAVVMATGTLIGMALQSLSKLVAIVDKVSAVHPLVFVAWGALSAAYKVWQAKAEQDQAIRELAFSLRDMLAFANMAKDLKEIERGIDVIKEMSYAIQDGAKLITEYMNTSGWIAVSNNMATQITNIRNRFLYLNEQFDRAVGVETWIVAGKTLQTLEELRAESDRKDMRELLGRLPSVHELEAGFDNVKGCLPGTRSELLTEVFQWIEDTSPSQTRIAWINGWAGTGKSTVASSIARSMESSQRLGATFFCSRSSTAERASPKFVYSTIAGQLAKTVPGLTKGICEALKNDQDLGKAATSTQFKKLILKPLLDAKASLVPVVVVIDALDECSAPGDVISALGSEAASLPPNLKIVMLSRPERNIAEHFDVMDDTSLWRRSLNHDEAADRDIGAYIADRMAVIAHRYGLDSDWPGEDHRMALVQKAGGLFIWVSTMYTFIEDEDEDDPERQLLAILDPGSRQSLDQSPWAHLDSLYNQVLTQAFSAKAPERRLVLFRKVIGAIVTVRNPLSPLGLGSLLDLRDTRDSPSTLVIQSVRKLQSILTIPATMDEPLKIIHYSLIDFLTSTSRCSDERFYVDPKQHHHSLALRCLQLMDQFLKPNMCQIDPSLLIKEISDLGDRVSQYLPEALQYACRFWAEHLKYIAPDDEIHELVKKFYRDHLLSWIEVLSLLDIVDDGFDLLETAEEWLKKFHVQDSALPALAYDARRFLNESRNVISESPIHVYYSALPFSPKKSLVYQTYFHKLEGCMHVLRGSPTIWAACICVLQGHENVVTSLAFSPDGRNIASGSWDNTVCIWDAKTGALLREPLRGHTANVNSVSYFRDGTRIVSGSADSTIVLWDVQKGVPIGDPFKGHTAEVTSLAISPDMQRIVSGSHDKTVRVWDVSTGTQIGNALEGHTHRVMSVRISPDGKVIATGSWDKTIRLWSATTLQPLGEPLQGHTERVGAVAFSPDGKTLASGSYDSTIRLWDVTSRTQVGNAMEGHTEAIVSVMFSPTGKRLVSGSTDSTIRTWDIATRTPLGDALEGHTHQIMSVAYSPDGSRIASASWDRTVAVWDATTAPPAHDSNQESGHKKWVTSIAFSPDAKRVVSSGIDKTIQIWDSDTGLPIGKTLKGHTDEVTAVKFSPDGNLIISGAFDKTLRLWNAHTGAPIGEAISVQHSVVTSVTFSASELPQILVGSFRSTLRLWDAETGAFFGEALEGETNLVTSIALSEDGKIATGKHDRVLRLWEAGTGTPIGEALSGNIYPLISVEFCPDSKRFITGTWEKTLRLWEAIRERPVANMFDESAAVVSSTDSVNERRVVSGSFDKTIRLWDATTGKQIGNPLVGHTLPITAVAFSPDGRLIVSGSLDKSLRLWDATTGGAIGDAMRGHTDLVSSVLFSADGTRIISGSWDNTLQLWDVATRQPAEERAEGHTDGICSVVFSADGETIVSESLVGGVLCWKLTSSGIEQSETREDLTASSTLFKLDQKTGWVFAGAYGRKLWWMPVGNRGRYAATVDGRFATGNSVGKVSILDGRNAVSSFKP